MVLSQNQHEWTRGWGTIREPHEWSRGLWYFHRTPMNGVGGGVLLENPMNGVRRSTPTASEARLNLGEHV